jgi:hypothetical protein
MGPKQSARLRAVSCAGGHLFACGLLKTTLAKRILKAAAQGERDRERLLDTALVEFCAEEA